VTAQLKTVGKQVHLAKLSLALGLFGVAACQSNTVFRPQPRLSLDGSQLTMLESAVIAGQVPNKELLSAPNRNSLSSSQNNSFSSERTGEAKTSPLGPLAEQIKNTSQNGASAVAQSSQLLDPETLESSDEAADEQEDSAVVEEDGIQDERDTLDADSARSPEEIAEVLENSRTDAHFALCEGSVYMLDWQKNVDSRFLSKNRKKYRRASSLRRAKEAARAEEFTQLLLPSLPNLDFDYPVVINNDVIKWIQYFQTRGRKTFVTWLRRAEDFIPKAIPVLEKHGLPRDLVYISMIESGFNNRALSSARASGPWQFMRETGRIYGLKQNDYVDERRDPEKATVAAAKYLTNLYAMFGDWHLAAASYNAGEGRVSRAMRGQKNKDFFSLSDAKRLPNETRNYVPKLIASMIISKNPARFGFDVAKGSRALQTTSVDIVKSIRLTDLAREISVDKTVLEHLNPELRLGITPPGAAGNAYKIQVPKEFGEQTQEVVENLPAAPRTHTVAARVRRSESVSRFARRHGITLSAVLKANPGIRKNSRLSRGQRVHIPVALGSGQYEKLTSYQNPKKYKKSKKRITKKRRSGNVKVATRRSKR
jgi:membrane-bound lytic murein transglycosylase D